MQRELTIGSRVVRFHCAKELAPQADWLEGVLKDIAAERGDDFFAPGKTIQLGWSLLTLVDKDGVLEVHEPDFDGNPAKQTRNDLTVTLTVIAQQNDIINALGVEPVPVNFLDKIVCVEGVLDAEDVFFQRSAPKGDDTGWTMKLLADPHRDTDYNWIFVHALLRIRPAAMKILTLPVGYMAFFLGDKLDAILDENDKQVYPKK
jgi:hypothetical protein